MPSSYNPRHDARRQRGTTEAKDPKVCPMNTECWQGAETAPLRGSISARRSMASMTDDTVENRFEVSIAPELEGGVYASFANLWHGPDVFTIDFAALSAPPERAQDDHGNTYNRFQTRVVSRVRIPPGQVFELMRALEIQLSAWESETGQKPQPPSLA